MSDIEFTQLVNQYTRLLFSICYRFVKDYHEAENLTQDTFLTAYRVIGSFEGENYKPWLVRIATNKCKDYLKSAYSRTTQATEDEVLSLVPDGDLVEVQVENDDGVERIRAACESLPDTYRDVALLHYLEDRSFEEIAVLLDRPVKTIQTQVYRARDKLRVLLREELCDV